MKITATPSSGEPILSHDARSWTHLERCLMDLVAPSFLSLDASQWPSERTIPQSGEKEHLACFSMINKNRKLGRITTAGCSESVRQDKFLLRYSLLGTTPIVFITLFLFFGCHTSLAMRLVVQRVKSASVRSEQKTLSTIGPGIVALVGLHENDTEDNLVECCKKLLASKLWPNENGGQWRHGVKQKQYEVLCVSQFTLYGTLSKKNQPDFKQAMKAIPAESLYCKFLSMLREKYEDDKIFDGKFGAMMDVDLINDGPVTLVIDSEPKGSNISDSTTIVKE